MRSVAAAAVIAAGIAGVSADLCAKGSQLINGNWYCQQVDAITYTGLKGSGSYNRVTSMNNETGQCSSVPQAYSGSMAPLSDEVSMHFRGPIKIEQIAVYLPGTASKAKRSAHYRRHGHQHFHEHNAEVREIQERAEAEKRAVGDMVIATINGKVVSWANTYGGATAAPAPAAQSTPAAAPAAAANAPAAAAAPAPSAAASSAPVAAGDWARVGYYNAKAGTAQGLTFLNHNGGAGSGVFDYAFGNSLSFASADMSTAASSPQVLKSMVVPSNKEFVVMSDKPCKDGSCGFIRPGTEGVAMHGWGGAQKAFLVEFSMPSDGQSGWNMDMSAWWMLNAQIPRTLQYGNAACSCWTSGCGEFDVFEVLDSGNFRCKSTLHSNIKGGNSDWFMRPTTTTIKAALVFNTDNIHIKILDSSTSFGSSLAQSAISDICTSTQTQNDKISLFALAS